MSEDLRKEGEKALQSLKEKKSPEAETVDPDGVPESESRAPEPEPQPSDAERIRAEKKARIAQVLSRGIVNEKLQAIVDRSVPEGRRGKFVLDHEEDVVRYKNLGFTFDYSKGAAKEHGSEDGLIRVGDLVLMTIDIEDRELLREIKMDRVQKKLGEGRRDYESRAEQHAARGGPRPFSGGKTEIKR